MWYLITRFMSRLARTCGLQSCVHHYFEQGVYDVDHKSSLEGESACAHPMRIFCNESQITNCINYGLIYSLFTNLVS